MTTGLRDWTGKALADGRYGVEEKIGEGGMGTVYRAKDRNLDAEVVIKVPLRSMLEDKDFARRFEVEVKALAKLSHPQIVKIMDVGSWDGLPFAVMQYLPGGSLEDRRPAPPEGTIGALDPKEVEGWLGGIAKALDYLHKAGYVHRDVKPGNILFDANGHPFLSDFGVVKVAASTARANESRATMTGTGMVIGTPEYMAPELVMGEEFDGRADQYALAVTAYEMLGGRRPFEDATKTKLLVLHSTRTPPSPSEFSPWIGEGISRAVLKGLAKAPGDRYPDCSALAEAIGLAVMAEFGQRPSAVRFRCPSCARTIAISSASFARFRKSPRAVDCPGCGSKIETSRSRSATATLVESPSPRRATMVEPIRRGPATIVEESDQAPTVRPKRTVVETIPIAAKPIRRSSATVVERSRTVVEPGLILASSQPLSDLSKSPRTGPPVAVWAASGSVAALALVVGVGILISRERRETLAPAAADPRLKTFFTKKPEPDPPTPAPRPRPSGERPRESIARKDEPKTPAQARDLPESGVSLAAGGDRSNPEPAVKSTSPVEDLPAAPPEPEKVEEHDPDEGPLARSPTFVELKKIADGPSQYAGQAIELKRLYYVERVKSLGDGIWAISVAQARLGFNRNYVVGIAERAKETHEMELDPDLAKSFAKVPALAGVGNSDATRVAALTVKVVRRKLGGLDDWGIRVVGLEFFQRIIPLPHLKNSYVKKIRVNIGTRLISSASDIESDDAQVWENSDDRLRPLVFKLKRDYENYWKMVAEAKNNRIRAVEDSAMMKMNSDSIKNQAALDSANRARIGLPR